MTSGVRLATLAITLSGGTTSSTTMSEPSTRRSSSARLASCRAVTSECSDKSRTSPALCAGQFFTNPATNSCTGICSSFLRSANSALIDSVCFGEKCAAVEASNFFTSTGMPSARRLR